MLHAVDFEQIVANDMVILGSPTTVVDTILRLEGARPIGLAMIFKPVRCPLTWSSAR